MKFFRVIFIILIVFHTLTQAQITVTPENPSVGDNVTITYDATAGNGELIGVSPVYIHTGVLTTQSQNPSDWFFVKNNWPVNTPEVEMQNMGNNIHQISFQIDNYYNLPNDVTVTDLAMVFRNADGSLVGRASDNGDIFYPIYPDNLNDNYVSHSLSNNQLIIQSTDHQYTIQAYTDDIFKVAFYESTNSSVEDQSEVVVLPPGNSGNISDQNDKLIYQTDNKKVIIEKNPITFKIVRDTDTIIRHSSGFFKQGDQTSVNFNISPDEAFHGSGMRAIDQNLRNQDLSIYNQANYGYDEGAKNLNFNVPFFLSTKPYGIYFEHQYPSDVSFDKIQDQLSYSVEDGSLAYFFIASDNIETIMEDYGKLTGYQSLPPRWALGYIQSKFGYETETEARNVVNQLKAENFPIDAIVLDLYWFGQPDEMGNLDWDTSAFPTPVDMVSDFQNDGVQTILITEPYITSNSTNYTTAINNGYVGVNSQDNAFVINDFWAGTAVLLNMMETNTQNWMWTFYKDRVNEGVTGWWCDLGEPENHPSNMLHNGETGREVHNYYSFNWAKMLYEKYQNDFPDQRIFNLIRSGYAGSQRYGALPWSGDINRSYTGMKTQIPIMINMGYSGLAYMHSDIGGFTGGGQNNELYTRWMQMGAFNPIMRAHGVGIPTEPTAYPQPYKDIVRSFIELRYKLLPYNYSLAFENSINGSPIVRSMDYHHPNVDGMSEINDQFFWGKDFLIAPILSQGSTSRTVTLPPGSWLDYFTGESFSGTINVNASIESMPIFVRNGAIIPHTDLVQTSEDYVADNLSFHYFQTANEQSSYTMYNDDGNSTGTIANNQFETITVNANKTQNSVTFDLSHNGGFANMPGNRTIEYVLKNQLDDPEIVSVDGINIPIFTTDNDYENNLPAALYDSTNDIIKLHFNWDNSNTTAIINFDNLDIEDPSKENLVVYPNPAKVKVNIQLNEQLNSINHVALYSMNGRKIYTFQLEKIKQLGHKIELQLPRSLSNGAYILEVKDQLKNFSAQLIISR